MAGQYVGIKSKNLTQMQSLAKISHNLRRKKMTNELGFHKFKTTGFFKRKASLSLSLFKV